MSFNEADTRAKLIDPVIHRRGWTEDLIRREETAGTVEIINGKARRRSRGKIDYVLRVKVNVDTQPVALALIEAKKESLPAGHGLDQAKGYSECKRLNVRFAFSSNGHQFVEFDCLTGLTSTPKPIAEFPTPADLRARYEQGIGFTLESPAARPLLQPYPGGEGARRYYQDAAIRAVMEKIARCQIANQPKRALLSLATGAGKTFIAVNLLKRVSDAGQLTRALFVCDRDELRTQALKAFQNVFGSDAAEVYRKPDGTNNAKNARIHIATYQTLGVESDNGDASFLTTFYPADYFTHVVIDECHRSAWGKWSQVLMRNWNAAQIGLTATPRQLECKEATAEAKQDADITANNVAYFGEPAYEYEIAQAIDDGYLAACEIQKGRVNLDDPCWSGCARSGVHAHGCASGRSRTGSRQLLSSLLGTVRTWPSRDYFASRPGTSTRSPSRKRRSPLPRSRSSRPGWRAESSQACSSPSSTFRDSGASGPRSRRSWLSPRHARSKRRSRPTATALRVGRAAHWPAYPGAPRISSTRRGSPLPGGRRRIASAFPRATPR
jgi:type I restriction enzyme R subunit